MSHSHLGIGGPRPGLLSAASMHRRPRSHCPQHESRRCESVSVNIVAYEQECVGVTEPDSVSTRQSALALAAGLRSTEHKATGLQTLCSSRDSASRNRSSFSARPPQETVPRISGASVVTTVLRYTTKSRHSTRYDVNSKHLQEQQT